MSVFKRIAGVVNSKIKYLFEKHPFRRLPITKPTSYNFVACQMQIRQMQ